jgi:hypothetical protein
MGKIKNYIWDKKELPQQIESGVIAINKKVDNIYCKSYPDKIVLSNSYKINLG